MDKRQYYQQQDVVDHYDEWRFGSPGGRYVDALEKATLLSLIAAADRSLPVLDLPCGTGRLLQAMMGQGFQSVWGADGSPAMLVRAKTAAPGATLVETDAFATPFEDAAFQVVCSLRFLFHIGDASRYLAEVARLLRPGGLFVFDTLRWTPRGLVPPIDNRLGGRLHCYSEARLAELMAAHGLRIVASVRVLALPSLAYRFLPDFLLGPVRWLDRHAPAWCLSKAFVLAVKEAGPGSNRSV